jgi:putative heme-binding domain-containing protein
MKHALVSVVLPTLALSLPFLPADQPGHAKKAERPFGIPKRVPWTSGRITGSPEPPPAYRSKRVFPKLTFHNPLLITTAPGTRRLFVGEHNNGKLYSFVPDPAVAKADLFLDLSKELSCLKDPKVGGFDAVYGLAFHPDFAKNHYCYICYALNSNPPGTQLSDGTHVSRFTVTDTDPPRVDPKSETVLLTWLAGGHNGGNLKFGPDGCLYISSGDGSSPNPPDALDAGQDMTVLLSKILRIDVDHPEKGKAYRVPADNPFVTTPKARPEIWCYGFRNPWQMSFDRKTGDLWVGDVGWELWEMVYKVERGGNYGWPVMEGPQPVKPEGKHGPTPIQPPTIVFPHSEAASITGGYVYRGKRLKELYGAYLCGDWATRKMWATRFDGKKKLWHKFIAQTNQQIVAFAEDRDGELYFLDYSPKGGIYQLVANERARGDAHRRFPRRLSETGLFADTPAHRPAPGVIPFSVNAAQWLDHATAERLVALPGTGTILLHDDSVEIPGTTFSGRFHYPKDGVLAKTITVELERGNPKSRRRLETQVLHFDGGEWHGYTYEWNDAQTDAVLVEAAGKDRTFEVKEARAPGGLRKQRWHFASRAECLRCHNPWADYTLAFTLPQINRDHAYGSVVDNQLRAAQHAGVFRRVPPDRGLPSMPQLDADPLEDLPPKLTDPYRDGDLDQRARSYLHVNCAHCHQFGAGGSADIQLRYDTPIDETKGLEARPAQGTFAIKDAQILAPADPYRSVLYYRMAKLGTGRMPHIGSEVVDEAGLRLMHDWIRRLPVRKGDRALVARLQQLDEATALAREKTDTKHRLKEIANYLAAVAGRKAPNEADRERARADLVKEHAQAVKTRAVGREEVLGKLLQDTSAALLLLRALDEDRLPAGVRAQAVAAAAASPDVQVRDLFERFLPESQRVRRLGPLVNTQALLALKGDAERGKRLLFSAAVQCLNCHKVGEKGSTLGPELTHVGKKLTRAQVLDRLLYPSKNMDPKYRPYLLETADGKLHTGLLVEKTARHVVLRTVQDQKVEVRAATVVSVTPQKVSLMPEQQLSGLTAEQAADLLAYIEALK